MLFNVSFNGWHGGSGLGPRYLSPIVPLLAVPMLFATRLYRPLWGILAAVSAALGLYRRRGALYFAQAAGRTGGTIFAGGTAR